MIVDKSHVADTEGMTVYSPRVKDMCKEDTPRERAAKYGVGVLSVADLWALILRTGAVGNPITSLCRNLMEANSDSLRVLERRTRSELQQIKGLGQLKALQIEAVMELVRRYNLEKPADDPVIRSSADIFALMSPKIGNIDHEEVWALFLNRGHKVMKLSCCSTGGFASSVFDVKMIIKSALLENSSALVLCHNHPSGQLRPSSQDDAITRKCREAATLMDISMLDHVIVTAHGYYSYADEGRM